MTTTSSIYYVPPMTWCGVDHPHGPHTFVVPSGATGACAQCPGSSGPAEARVLGYRVRIDGTAYVLHPSEVDIIRAGSEVDTR